GFANYMLGPVAFIIPILVAASAYGASNGTCLIASRLPFVAAREGHSAELMSYVQVNRLTPAPSLIFNITDLKKGLPTRDGSGEPASYPAKFKFSCKASPFFHRKVG
ncbi:b(0,+)-type amino acid transporter 1, partial [Nephila pilipes]